MIPLRDADRPGRRALVTVGLIALNAVVFAVELLVEGAGPDALEAFFRSYGVVPAALVAALEAGEWLSAPVLSLLTSQLLHAGWLHLGFNMLYLWIFGNNVEAALGRSAFLGLYLAGGVAAAAVEVAAQVLRGAVADIPLVGASGAISAVLGAYLVWFPRARVLSVVYLGLFFQLVHVPALLLLGLWFVVQLLAGVAALDAPADVGGVAYFAHIGGFAAGLIVAVLLRVTGRVRR